MNTPVFFNRDVSWLSFNGRLLTEADNDAVPLLERIRFLSIYSSNLDEFYRVRIPALTALKKIKKTTTDGIAYAHILKQIEGSVQQQLNHFGEILKGKLIPQLKEKGYHFVYNSGIPEVIKQDVTTYFFNEILGYIQLHYIKNLDKSFFPENNKLYFLVITENETRQKDEIIIEIPSDRLPRFFSIERGGTRYIVALDDIISDNLEKIFTNEKIKGCYSFKITRDAELNLKDEYKDDLAEKMEEKIAKRDNGLATRFLHSPHLPAPYLHMLADVLGISKATFVTGGRYHNLKDLASFPVSDKALSYTPMPSLPVTYKADLLLDEIAQRDILLHTPYHQYHNVLRFFNEASVRPKVTEIYATLYRAANNSAIVQALINAARNGKKVTVLVELKARFDESNNIKWARKMKSAGVKIIYSELALKVHAKIALVKREEEGRIKYSGLFSTGNFNESTARFYTDHVLLTSHKGMLQETEQLFMYLSQKKKLIKAKQLRFDHLLVAQFNLQQRFIDLIDREIANARDGFPAAITIKLNNLEERVLIEKLYEASNAGVNITLIVRTICCLIPGVKGMSENITIRRIVDRYLEHGRIFVFHNNGDPHVYMGSADWMNRNIYGRIEVCFPVYKTELRQQISDLLDIQLADNVNAVTLDDCMQNVPVERQTREKPVQSQVAIYHYLKSIQ